MEAHQLYLSIPRTRIANTVELFCGQQLQLVFISYKLYCFHCSTAIVLMKCRLQCEQCRVRHHQCYSMIIRSLCTFFLPKIGTLLNPPSTPSWYLICSFIMVCIRDSEGEGGCIVVMVLPKNGPMEMGRTQIPNFGRSIWTSGLQTEFSCSDP